MSAIVIVSHFGIVVGYFLFGMGIMSRMRSTHRALRGWGMLFFVTCGLTHIDLLAHMVAGEVSIEDFLDPIHVVVHVVQVVAVWGFALELYRAFIVRGEWPALRDDHG